MSSVEIPILGLVLFLFVFAFFFILTLFLLFLYLQNKRQIAEKAQQLNLEWQQRALDGVRKELTLQANQNALKQLENWRNSEIETVKQQQYELAHGALNVEFEQWKVEYEKTIRQDAIAKSQSTLVGKITEHFIPFLPDFTYNPKDARFLGSPIDYVVFDGLSEGELKKIVLIEIKTNLGTLTKRERQIRDVVQSGNVEWTQLKRNVEIASEEPA